MHQKSLRAIAALAALSVLAACSDARLEKINLGMSKEQVATAMGDAPHRSLGYLTQGKNWDVQLYARTSVEATDSVLWRKMSPVIFIDDKAVGWGWSWWGNRAAKEKIEMPPS
ncbi:MAG TPA: DUF3192 domain-containing protein [Gemmatimonadales bacterium]|jgi:hypothetical protein